MSTLILIDGNEHKYIRYTHGVSLCNFEVKAVTVHSSELVTVVIRIKSLAAESLLVYNIGTCIRMCGMNNYKHVCTRGLPGGMRIWQFSRGILKETH